MKHLQDDRGVDTCTYVHAYLYVRTEEIEKKVCPTRSTRRTARQRARRKRSRRDMERNLLETKQEEETRKRLL